MDGFRKEFQLKNVGFEGVSETAFVLPQAKWCCQPYTWIAYRFATALYLTTWLIFIIFYWGVPPYYPPADNKAKWFIYISNWTYLCMVTYYWTSAAGTLMYHKRTNFEAASEQSLSVLSFKDNPNGFNNQGLQIDEPGQQDQQFHNTNKHAEKSGSPRNPHSPTQSLSWNFKVTWVLQNICFAGALFVALLFWILDFDPETSNINALTLHVHGVNLIFVLADQFLIGSPYRILHFIYPSTYSLVYFTFTGIYYAVGGLNEAPPDDVIGNTYIYKGKLDWGRAPVTSGVVTAIVVFIAAPVLHLAFYGLYRLRISLGIWCEYCKGN